MDYQEVLKDNRLWPLLSDEPGLNFTDIDPLQLSTERVCSDHGKVLFKSLRRFNSDHNRCSIQITKETQIRNQISEMAAAVIRINAIPPSKLDKRIGMSLHDFLLFEICRMTAIITGPLIHKQ